MSAETAERALKHFLSAGPLANDPPMVLPARIALDLSGEAIRARLCTFSGPNSEELALRPDLTLALALQRVAALDAGSTDQDTLSYRGRAFRLPSGPGEDVEFEQVGFERYGAASSPEEDAEVLARVAAACRAAGLKEARLMMGDVSLFETLIGVLDLPEAWQARLTRRFRGGAPLNRVIASDDEAASGAVSSSGLAQLVERLEGAEAESLLAGLLGLAGVETIGERGLDEVLQRLSERRRDGTRQPLPPRAAEILGEVLEMEGTPDDVLTDLRALATREKLDALEPALDRIAARQAALQQMLGDALPDRVFAPAFGRRFTYYDGFVFQIEPRGAPADKPAASGGRYDTMIARLSQGRFEETAIGGMVRPDRLDAEARS